MSEKCSEAMKENTIKNEITKQGGTKAGIDEGSYYRKNYTSNLNSKVCIIQNVKILRGIWNVLKWIEK